MQRWHVSLGLIGLVVAAVVVTPRLYPRISEEAPPPLPTTRVAPTPVPLNGSGSLTLQVGLDRTSVLAGGTSDRYVVITLTAPAAPVTAAPVDMAVVLDTSGSMTRDDAIDHARQAARTVVDRLGPNDWFTLVTFDDLAETVVSHGRVDRAAAWLAIARISEGGTTNLYGGLERAGAELTAGPLDNIARPQRVLLVSDGKPTSGVQDEATIERLAARLQTQGITVSTLGLGPDYNEDLLARIADLGGGSWHHVSQASGLEGALGAELTQTTQTVADGTMVSIHLPNGVEGVSLLGLEGATTSDGWTVNLGQIHGGETRKVVAKVRVHAGYGESMPVAFVTADWVDRLVGYAGHAESVTSAPLQPDPWEAEASQDPLRTRLAAEAGVLLRRSAERYAAGDLSDALDLADRAADGVANIPEMAAQAESIRRQREWYSTAAPASDEGQQAIKQNKYTYRGLVR